MTDLKTIHSRVSDILSAVGFEVYPFLIGWYNENVQELFKLPYPPDTLAFIIISTPAMFDKAFKPFVCRHSCLQGHDPIDECMIYHFSLIKEAFPAQIVEVMHDFEMTATRRPRVLVQTAGHVAGAAYYYQRRDVVPDYWPSSQKIYGVSVHPKYGGWFALRAVVVFSQVCQPDLPRPCPPDCLQTREERVRLLEAFNTHWQDGAYRDIVPVLERYSSEQQRYFGTPPAQRQAILQDIRASCQQ